MRLYIPLLLALLTPTFVRADNDADLKKLQGKWQVVKAVEDGKSIPADEIKKMGLLFRENTAVPLEDDQELVHEKAEIELDAGKSPAHLNIFPLDKDGKRRDPVPSIYKFDNENLIIVMGIVKMDRPTKFEEGTGQFFLQLQRKK